MLSWLIRCFRSALSNICFGTLWCILHGDVLAAQSTFHDDAYSLLWIALHDAFYLPLRMLRWVLRWLRSASGCFQNVACATLLSFLARWFLEVVAGIHGLLYDAAHLAP